MSTDYELGVIGGGNMAEAILGAAVAGGVVAADRIVVGEPSAARRAALAAAVGVTVEEGNAAAAGCPKVLLAIKPQMMAEVLAQIAPAVRGDALVVSIAAGVPAATITEGLGGKGRVVRVMPNTPMLAGAGASGVAAGPGATDDDMDWALKLFGAGGSLAFRVPEEQLDAVTAVSGSGPAYFFYLIEAMVAAGVAEGLPTGVSTQLANQTCLGAAKLLAKTHLDAAELRRRVTSPNGTTQRAIETLDGAGAMDAIVRAVRAAAERSRELAR